MSARLDFAITLRDGRRLALTEWGIPDGRPVLFCHGMPGSRLWCPDEAATTAADVRLIIPDRPGVGGSDPKPRRSVGDWPADVVELADALGLSTFGVLGASGGGLYAAACAARIPSRLTDVAIVSSGMASIDWEARPGVVATWDAQDREEFELARGDPDAAAALAADHYQEWVIDLAQRPESLHATLEPPEGDRWFFADPARVHALNAALRETPRQGVNALAWELIAPYLPWGFRLGDISIPVRIWHGGQDPLVSQEDIDYLVGAIRRTSIVIWPDSGHLGAAKHFDEVLANIAA